MHVERIATRLNNRPSFSRKRGDVMLIISIIGFVLPYLLRMCEKNPTPESIRKRIEANYNYRDGKYKKGFLRRVANKIKHIAWHEKKVDWSLEQCTDAAIEYLDEARLAENSQLAAAL